MTRLIRGIIGNWKNNKLAFDLLRVEYNQPCHMVIALNRSISAGSTGLYSATLPATASAVSMSIISAKYSNSWKLANVRSLGSAAYFLR